MAIKTFSECGIRLGWSLDRDTIRTKRDVIMLICNSVNMSIRLSIATEERH